jgi:hypothetical protein
MTECKHYRDLARSFYVNCENALSSSSICEASANLPTVNYNLIKVNNDPRCNLSGLFRGEG